MQRAPTTTTTTVLYLHQLLRSQTNSLFSSWCFKRSTVTHSIMVCGSLGTKSRQPNTPSDASVMACEGAVVWRFDVPIVTARHEVPQDASRLLVNEELVMLRSLAKELLQVRYREDCTLFCWLISVLFLGRERSAHAVGCLRERKHRSAINSACENCSNCIANRV